MASRPELVQMAKELDIDHKSVRVEKLTEKVKEAIDKEFDRKFLISPEDVSSTLLKFMCEEYDYFLVDKEGKRHNYMEEPIE
jgi:hypothetical protein